MFLGFMLLINFLYYLFNIYFFLPSTLIHFHPKLDIIFGICATLRLKGYCQNVHIFRYLSNPIY